MTAGIENEHRISSTLSEDVVHAFDRSGPDTLKLGAPYSRCGPRNTKVWRFGLQNVGMDE